MLQIENVSTETNNDLRSSQNIYGFETEFKQKQVKLNCIIGHK